MNSVFVLAADFACCCFVGAMLLALVRLFIGPSAQDRVLAFDSMNVNAMLLLLVLGVRSGTSAYFDVALLIALLGFIGTTALAKFLLRGEVIGP